MFKFLHAADIHLDSPLRGLSRYEGAPTQRIRLATREALKALIQTAIDEQVAFVVIAGDVFDGDWKDYNTGLFFANQMSRLRREGIRVFMIAGNHDAASLITKTLRMPDNVTLFSTAHPESVDTYFIPGVYTPLYRNWFASEQRVADLTSLIEEFVAQSHEYPLTP